MPAALQERLLRLSERLSDEPLRDEGLAEPEGGTLQTKLARLSGRLAEPEPELPPPAAPGEVEPTVLETTLDLAKKFVRGAAVTTAGVPAGVVELVETIDAILPPPTRVLDEMREAAGAPPAEPVIDVKEWPEKVQQLLDVHLPTDPRQRDSVLGKLASGTGTTVPFALAYAIGGYPLAAAVGAAAGAEEFVPETEESEVPEVKKALATLARGALGTTQALPIGKWFRFLKPIDVATKGGFFRRIAKEGGRIALPAVYEGMQEFTEQAGADILARTLLESERTFKESLERTTEAGEIGAGVGLIFSVLARLAGVSFRPKAPTIREGAEQAKGIVERAVPALEAARPDIESRVTQLRKRGLSEKAARREAKAELEPKPTAPEEPVVQPEPVPVAERSPTSIKNAIVDQERAARGLPPAMQPARRSFGAVWDDAVRLADEQPSKQDALIRELAGKPRPVSDTEDALLLHRQIRLQNEYDKTLQRHGQAQKAGDIEATASLESQQEALLRELLELYDIDKAVGTATSRGLNARKMLAREDFSLVRMAAMKRTAKGGGQLSEKDAAAVGATQKKIADLETQLQERTERITFLESEAALTKSLKEMAASEVPARKKARTAAAEVELDEAWKDFAGRVSGKLFANPLDPALVGSAARLAKAYVKVGVLRVQDFLSQVTKRIGKEEANRFNDTLVRAWDQAIAEQTPTPRKAGETAETVARDARKLAKFFVSTGIIERNALVDAVHRELRRTLPELTRRQAMDAISGYGQYARLSQGDVEVLLRDLKGQMQQVAKLEDMQAKRPPLKTGVERRVPSDEERHLIQQVNQMKRQGGFDVTDPATQLRSALDAVKTRLRNQIADLEQQISTKEKIVKKRTAAPQDEEVRKLMARRDSLREQFDEIFGVREMSEEQRLRIATASAKRSIAEYERRISTRDFEGRKPKRKSEVNAELQALRERRDALRAEFKELRDLAKPKATPEQRALSALKARLRTRAAEYQDRLARRDFAPKVRKKTTLDKEAEELRFQAEQAKADFLKELAADARQRRTTWEKVWGVVPELLNTARATIVSMDLSAVGRQGGIVNFGHPLRGRKGLRDMLAAFSSKAVASRAQNELTKRPNAALYKRAGLELTDPEGRLSQQEEVYMSRWAKTIPGVAGSERAYVTYLNRIRADTFDVMTATLGRNGTITEAEAKVIANYVNVATGRGNLGRFKAASVPLATVFFAPRFVLSRFQYLTLQPLRMKGGTARTRKLIAQEYARTLTGLGLFYSTAAMALWSLIGPPGDEEDWNIELDPRSSDFGKIRIGDTRIDPLFGLSQITVLLSRLATGRTKGLKGGDIMPIRGEKVPYGRGTGADVIARFMRTKLAPAIGTSINVLAGRNVIGEPTTPKTVARDLVVPISMRDIGTLMKKHGIPAGTVLALLEIFGTSVQHYDEGDSTRVLLRERSRLQQRDIRSLTPKQVQRRLLINAWYSNYYLPIRKQIKAVGGNESLSNVLAGSSDQVLRSIE